MKTLLSLLALGMVGCGAIEGVTEPQVDAGLAPYLDEVLSWTGDERGNIVYKVYFVPGEDFTVSGGGRARAACNAPQVYLPHSRTIRFAEGWWAQMNEAQRLRLMAHEVIHCYHNHLGHKKTGIMVTMFNYSDEVTVEQVKAMFYEELER